jgi:predicted deacylase
VNPRRPPLPPPPRYPVELLPEPIGHLRRSDTGIDYVHTFDSGAPGPHVMVNALTHGNELCGMVAVRRLLESGLRPRRGRLTLGFANVAAYERFDPESPDSRFVDRDFNRIWRDEILDADRSSVEAARARAMRPLVASVDRLLDLHSTWHALEPFFVVPGLPRSRALADALGFPACQLVLQNVSHEGAHLIDYGRFRDPDAQAASLIVECGQHFARRTADTALAVALRFLVATGAIDADDGAATGEACGVGAPPPPAAPGSIVRYVQAIPVIARTDDFGLACSHAGFEAFPAGAIVAWDGDDPVRAPFDGAVVLAPRPDPRRGQQAFAWGRTI